MLRQVPKGEYVLGFRWCARLDSQLHFAELYQYVRLRRSFSDLGASRSRLHGVETAPRGTGADRLGAAARDCETSSQVWTSCADITIA